MKACFRTFSLSAVTLLLAGYAYSATATTRHPNDSSMKTLAVADMTAAHLAELAQNKTATLAVRDLAQSLDKDAIDDYGQLSNLATKSGESIPKGIDEKRIPAIRTLASEKGQTFERTFLRNEIASEQRAISALKFEAAHGSSPDIKAWAQKALSTHQQDLERAQKLMK